MPTPQGALPNTCSAAATSSAAALGIADQRALEAAFVAGGAPHDLMQRLRLREDLPDQLLADPGEPVGEHDRGGEREPLGVRFALRRAEVAAQLRRRTLRIFLLGGNCTWRIWWARGSTSARTQQCAVAKRRARPREALAGAPASFGFLFASPDLPLRRALRAARTAAGTQQIIGCTTRSERTDVNRSKAWEKGVIVRGSRKVSVQECASATKNRYYATLSGGSQCWTVACSR